MRPTRRGSGSIRRSLARALSAGDAEIGAQFEAIRTDVLVMERDAAALAREIVSMRQRVAEGHPNRSDLFDLKHDRGGMVDIEFIVQYWVLLHAREHREFLLNAGNIPLLKIAAQSGLIADEEADAIGAAYWHYRKLQHTLRLDGVEKARVAPTEVQVERDAVAALWERVFAAATRA